MEGPVYCRRVRRRFRRYTVHITIYIYHMRSIFLLAAAVALVLSIYNWFNGSAEAGIFIGLWVPSILALGIFMQGRKR